MNSTQICSQFYVKGKQKRQQKLVEISVKLLGFVVIKLAIWILCIFLFG